MLQEGAQADLTCKWHCLSEKGDKRKGRDLLNAWWNSKVCFSLLIVCCLAVESYVNGVCYRGRKLPQSYKHQEVTFPQSLADTIRQ